MPDLRRTRLRGVQTVGLGRTAALRPGASGRAAPRRRRSGGVERVRLRPGADAPGDDALRNRRYSPVHRRRSSVFAAVLAGHPGGVPPGGLFMKFSYQWLRELVGGLEIPPKDLMRLITLKTAECEGVEQIGKSLESASEAVVAAVEPIPGGHYRKAVIETIRYGRKTVVCGAENCRPGVRSIYVPAGKKIIAGVESDGMLASAAELGIGRDHSGIVELGSQPAPQPDYAVEVDNKSLTHRPDLWGHYGMAREVAAIFGKKLVDPVKRRDIPGAPAIGVRIEDYSLCPRYSALALDHVTVRPSPGWMAERLKSVGLNAINNIVDVTNYVMAELAQPMHAFDAAKLQGGIVVRR